MQMSMATLWAIILTVLVIIGSTLIFFISAAPGMGGASEVSDGIVSQPQSPKSGPTTQSQMPSSSSCPVQTTPRPKEAVKNIPVRPGANRLPTSAVPDDVTVLTSDHIPREYVPEVGNGHIATVVQSDTIFMNGLYNGANFSSHRARIPSPSGYLIQRTTPSHLNRSYSLDLGRGLFTESYTGSGVSISLRTYAHRVWTSVLVSELVMERSDPSTPVEAVVGLTFPEPSEDIDFSEDIFGMRHGRTREAEYPELAPQTDFYIFNSTSLEGRRSMSEGRTSESYLAVTVINVDRDVVLREWALALTAFEDGDLLSSHVREWSAIWNRGRIDVEGNDTIARINYACLYYILSSLPFNGATPSWPFIGLSPGGLAHGSQGQDYLGHVFWDQDTWMFPPIALLYPDLGQLLVTTRTKTLEAAKLLAKRMGYDGAKYPWESAFTGLETCPAQQYGLHEIHINGDVAMMFRQYWQLSYDRHLMVKGSGAEVVWETAKYWVSRATHLPENDTYTFQEVMPPDEWHYPINDSAYTNNIAALTLQFANLLKRELGQPENATWTEVSEKMLRPYDPRKDFHPEYQGFHIYDRTKQADVVLLAFPLMVPMNDSTRANDLTIYENSTPIGPAPAMTWGMFSLGWLDLANTSKAAQLFHRSILNVQQPFLVWSENSDGSGATNFQTGMGGYLQSVLFGYGGIRLHDDKMTFNPQLIPTTTKVTFTGVNYQGGSLDLQFTSDSMSLTLTSMRSDYPGLQLKMADSQQWQTLEMGQLVQRQRQRFELRPLQKG